MSGIRCYRPERPAVLSGLKRKADCELCRRWPPPEMITYWKKEQPPHDLNGYAIVH